MNILDQWLYKAKQDYDSAIVLFNAKLNSPSMFHTQECAEKALKAFSVYKNMVIPKSHNLDELWLKCSELDKDFIAIHMNVIDLNGFDIRFRNQEVILDPSVNDVQNAIIDSELIFTFVKSKCI